MQPCSGSTSGGGPGFCVNVCVLGGGAGGPCVCGCRADLVSARLLNGRGLRLGKPSVQGGGGYRPGSHSTNSGMLLLGWCSWCRQHHSIPHPMFCHHAPHACHHTCTCCSSPSADPCHPFQPTIAAARVVKVSELARSVSSEAMGRINRIKAELHTAKEEALRARRQARHASDQVGGGLLLAETSPTCASLSLSWFCPPPVCCRCGLPACSRHSWLMLVWCFSST
jgi:hypothetical protein